MFDLLGLIILCFQTTLLFFRDFLLINPKSYDQRVFLEICVAIICCDDCKRTMYKIYTHSTNQNL